MHVLDENMTVADAYLYAYMHSSVQLLIQLLIMVNVDVDANISARSPTNNKHVYISYSSTSFSGPELVSCPTVLGTTHRLPAGGL